MYSEAELAALNAPRYRYNGKELTEYEATQRQRQIERNIRRWKREKYAMEAAGLDTGEASAKLHTWQERQRDFLRQTGLKRQHDRERVEAVAFSPKPVIMESYRGHIPVKGGAVPEALRNQARQANDMVCKEFPALRDSVDEIAFEPLEGDTAAEDVLRIDRTGAVSHRMGLNSTLFGSEQQVRDMLLRDFERGYSYETTDPRSLIAHELGHAAHNTLALKRAGWTPGAKLSPLQIQLFQQERSKILQEVYLAGFTDETFEEIVERVEADLGSKAIKPEEMIAQCFGNYYFGQKKSPIARKIVEFFRKGLM